MNIFLLKVLHLAGVFALFASLGATLLAGSNRKSASMLHGIALALVALVGFAMLGKPPINESWWMLKLCMWLFLGAAPVLAKRKVLPSSIVFILSLAAAAFAAWLGLHRGF